MKMKLLTGLLCFLPLAVDAAIPYQAEQVRAIEKSNDSESFARYRRFYAGAAFNLAMWQDEADDVISVSGKNTGSFELMAGVRLYDTFRLEANYYHANPKWDGFSLSGNTMFVNALFDARIDSMYRPFRAVQKLIPYVGFGLGVSFNSASGATIESDISPVAAGLVGMGIELGDRFALDFGYRYFYMFSPNFDVMQDLAPAAHQLRFGARVNF